MPNNRNYLFIHTLPFVPKVPDSNMGLWYNKHWSKYNIASTLSSAAQTISNLCVYKRHNKYKYEVDDVVIIIKKYKLIIKKTNNTLNVVWNIFGRKIIHNTIGKNLINHLHPFIHSLIKLIIPKLILGLYSHFYHHMLHIKTVDSWHVWLWQLWLTSVDLCLYCEREIDVRDWIVQCYPCLLHRSFRHLLMMINNNSNGYESNDKLVLKRLNCHW